MNRFSCFLTMFAVAASTVSAAITGKISDDNGNPLAGIRVTDGFSVTLSLQDGSYSIEGTSRSNIVSVVIPADKKSDTFWRPVEKDRTDGYDFVLSPRPKRDTFSFIQFSDEEESQPIKPFYADVRDRALAEDAAFVISTGDLCYERGVRSAGENMKAETFGGVRAYVTLGNHDLIGEHGTGDLFYEKQCGPTRYAFIEGNVLFIVLPMIYGDRKPSYTLDDIAIFTKSLLATWEKGKPVFFACHFYSPYINKSRTFAPSSKNAFSLADWKMSGFIYGHTHWYHANPDDPIPLWNTGQSRCGGGGNMPGAMRIFHMDAEGNCVTELAESNVPPLLNGLCAPDGTIAAVAYATAGIISDVTAVVNGEKIALKKQNGWLWSGKCNAVSEQIMLSAQLHTGRETRTLEAKCKPSASTNLALERIIPLKGHVIFGEPVIAKDRIVVGLADENSSKEGGIVAYDVNNGEMVWEITTGFSIRNSIILKDGVLYACDADNGVYKIDPNDGRLIWVNREPSASYNDICHSAPGLGAGKVFAGCGTVLRAIDDESGKTQWKLPKNAERFGSTMGPVYSNGKVFLTINWGYLQGFDAETGNLLWDTKDVEIKRGFMFQPTLAVLEDGSILRCEGTRGISIFNPDNGELIREMEKPERLSTASRPLVSNGTAYSGASMVGLCAVDLATMKTKWTLASVMKNSILSTVQYHGPDKIMEASPIMADGKLICAGGDGIIYIVNPEDGKILDSFDSGAPLLGAPTYKNGKLFITDYAGRLLQFSMNYK